MTLSVAAPPPAVFTINCVPPVALNVPPLMVPPTLGNTMFPSLDVSV